MTVDTGTPSGINIQKKQNDGIHGVRNAERSLY